jgi:thiol:disulfide interchange protein
MTKTTSFLALVAFIAAIVLVWAYWHKTADLPKDHPKQQERWDDWELDEVVPIPPEKPQEEEEEEEVPETPATYQQALDLAKRTDRPIFLVFEADWCSWCQKFKKTLNDPRVQKALADYVVYHADKDRETDLAKQYEVGGIPAYFVVDASEKIIKKGKGYKGAEVFLVWIR